VLLENVQPRIHHVQVRPFGGMSEGRRAGWAPLRKWSKKTAGRGPIRSNHQRIREKESRRRQKLTTSSLLEGKTNVTRKIEGHSPHPERIESVLAPRPAIAGKWEGGSLGKSPWVKVLIWPSIQGRKEMSQLKLQKEDNVQKVRCPTACLKVTGGRNIKRARAKWPVYCSQDPWGGGKHPPKTTQKESMGGGIFIVSSGPIG